MIVDSVTYSVTFQRSPYAVTFASGSAVSIDLGPRFQTLASFRTPDASKLVGILPATSLPALGGDVISTAGSATLSLNSVNSAPGTYGTASTVPALTVDAKGRVTAVNNVPISYPAPAFASITGKPTTLAGYGITDALTASSTAAISAASLTLTGKITAINSSDGHQIGRFKVDYDSNSNPLIGSEGNSIIFNVPLISKSSSSSTIASGTSSTTGLSIQAQRLNTPIKFATAPVTNGTVVTQLTIAGDGTVTAVGTVSAANIGGTSGHQLPYLDQSNTWSALQTLSSPVKLGSSSSMIAATSTGSTTTSGHQVFGLAGHSTNFGNVGAMVFTAPVAGNFVFLQFHVKGVIPTMGIIDFIVQASRGNGIINQTYKTATGNLDLQARVAIDPNGNSCLILGDVGTTWGNANISIAFANFSNSVTDAQCSGWTTALVTDLSAYTLSATIPTNNSTAAVAVPQVNSKLATNQALADGIFLDLIPVTLAQGTWIIDAQIQFEATSSTNVIFAAKLYDGGTTIYSSATGHPGVGTSNARHLNLNIGATVIIPAGGANVTLAAISSGSAASARAVASGITGLGTTCTQLSAVKVA